MEKDLKLKIGTSVICYQKDLCKGKIIAISTVLRISDCKKMVYVKGHEIPFKITAVKIM